eukprot:scaffold4440_cov109-Isochrysis_galbana.AAC.4
MMTRSAESACCAAGGDMAGAYSEPAAWRRSAATISLEPATYPPTEPKDLVKVPIITSTSAVGTPRWSVTPRPRGPTAPMECASSRYK